jgi:hypothetical protein
VHRVVALALVGLLVACNAPGNAETDEATGSASLGASETAAAGPSAACEESFTPIADMEVSSLAELGDLEAEVQPTVEACESVADWIAGAELALGTDVRQGTAQLLLRIHCVDLSLANTPICGEL